MGVALRLVKLEVRVYEGDQLVAEVIATVELKQGAGGGYYGCVELKKKKQG